MNEFALRHGRVGRGVLAAAGAAVKFIVLPLLLVLGTAVLLVEAVREEDIVLLGLDALVPTIVVLGTVIAGLSFFIGFYPRGSLSRLAFGLATAVAAGAWVWTVTRGGRLELTLDAVEASVDYSPLVLLLLAAVALGGLYYVVEARTYRAEWLAALPGADGEDGAATG